MIGENEEAERIVYPKFYRQEEGIHLPALVLDWLGQGREGRRVRQRLATSHWKFLKASI